jgi:hypothetical protein
MNKQTLQDHYGKSVSGNFYVTDTIGVPHAYCIGTRHVTFAADKFGGMLGNEAIRAGEKKGIRCEVKGCNLTFEQHEKALLIACKAELKDKDGQANPELHAYLLACKENCEKDGFVGFAFIED